jgi:hypothetical protein
MSIGFCKLAWCDFITKLTGITMPLLVILPTIHHLKQFEIFRVGGTIKNHDHSTYSVAKKKIDPKNISGSISIHL